MTGSKTCTKCGETKPLSEFYVHRAAADGRSFRCKYCIREDQSAASAELSEVTKTARSKKKADYYEKHKEHIRQHQKSYRNSNKDLVAAQKLTYSLANKDTILSSRRASYLANPEPARLRAAAWVKDNPEKAAQTRRRYAANHPEVGRKAKAAYKAKSLSTPKGKLAESVAKGVRRGIITGSKSGRKSFDLVGYTSEQLRTHLEARFQPGMTWDNYAHDTWHIDHIVPLSSFLFDTPDDPGFKSAWALANLQPLWAKENMSKGNRLDHPSTVSALAANDNLPLKFAA